MLFLAFAGGCVGEGQVGYSAHVTAPELVVVSPGVQVVADYDEPVFYSENFYWRQQGGYWYRSAYHTHGWARVEVAPVAIRTIERPSMYVHYHGTAGANVANRHPAPTPVVRDHREEQQEKQERKEDRKDERREDKKDKKDKKDKHD